MSDNKGYGAILVITGAIMLMGYAAAHGTLVGGVIGAAILALGMAFTAAGDGR